MVGGRFGSVRIQLGLGRTWLRFGFGSNSVQFGSGSGSVLVPDAGVECFLNSSPMHTGS